MNKILIFLLIISIILLSCSRLSSGDRINSIENRCENKTNCPNCLHYMENGGAFWDSCGKFKVGDKIKIIIYE